MIEYDAREKNKVEALEINKSQQDDITLMGE